MLLIAFTAHAFAWTIQTDAEYQKNIINYLNLKLGPEENWENFPELMMDFAQDALRPYGYLHPHITINTKDKTLAIDLGESVKIEKISIHKAQDCPIIDIKDYSLKYQIFRNDFYTKIKESLLTAAYEKGFYDAAVTGDVKIKNNKAFIDLSLQCHTPYTFKGLHISSPFASSLYTSHMHHPIDTPVGNRDFETFKNSIAQKSYLGQHEIVELRDPENNAVYWQVIHRSIAPDQKSVGAGFISGKGLDIILQYSRMQKPYAKNIHILSHISSQSIDGQITYTFPSAYFTHGLHSFRLFHEIFPNHRFNQISQSEFTYRLIHQTTKKMSEYGIAFKYNKDIFLENTIHSYALYPYVLHDYAWTGKTSSHLLRCLFKTSSRKLGSKLNFISASTDYHYRSKFFSPFLTKIDIHLAGIIHEKNIPASWLYRTGGPISVMGYPVDSIGPGDYLTVGRAGIFYPLSTSWYMGYWLSAGDAVDTIQIPKNFGHAIAFDIQTPVGAIELAFAKTKKHRIQFSLTLLPL